MKSAKLHYLIFFIINYLYLFSQGNKFDFNADIQTISPKPYQPIAQYEVGKRQSIYLTMSDSVKIAVDYYLPKGLKPGEKVPTIFYMTRYWRGVDLTFPPKSLKRVPGTINFNILDFTKHGYAVVAMDVRGTGASQGTKCLSMPDYREIQDGKEVLDWIIKQEWSDSKIGITGVSYIGITAELMLLTKHPSIKAVAPLFALFDAYDDISNPNGIYYERFLTHWAKFCEDMDRNTLPEEKQNFAMKLVKPVVSHRGLDKKEYKKAIESHRHNACRTDWGSSLSFTDQKFSNDGSIMATEFLSPHLFPEYYQHVPIYVMSGWKDAALVNAAVKQFLNWKHPDNKLILGPWTHGGSINAHPYGRKLSEFSFSQELLKFFDYHLKGIQNGINQEPKVHYYSFEHGRSASNHWYGSQTWPPFQKNEIWILNGNRLVRKDTNEIVDRFSLPKIDTLVYKPLRYSQSNAYSRWNLSGHVPLDEEKSNAILKNGIVIESGIFHEPRKITGHILLHAHWASTHPDPELYYYLMEIPEKGEAKVISDGLFRLIHATTVSKPLYTQIGTFYSFNRKTSTCIIPNTFYQASLDFFPVSYQVMQGSKIALVITTSDQSYFNIQNGSADIQMLSNFQLEIPFEE